MDDYGSSGPVPEGPKPGQDDDLHAEQDTLWDGSEAEFVPDEDAHDYEEQQPGIGLNYVLKPEEVLACLKRGRYIRSTGVRAGIEVGLLGAMAVLFGISYFVYGSTHNLVMTILCLLLCAVVIVVPNLALRQRAKHIANGKELHVEVYPDTVVIGRGAGQWEIPLDGASQFDEYDDLLVLTTPKNKMLAIPLRAVEPAVLADVQAMLAAGSAPPEAADL